MTPPSGRLRLPETFPQSDYTPFGYLDNPYHSAVFNRSGVIRTVPPMGFGWWARAMPWPYGIDVERPVSYLSFLHLSLAISGDTSAPVVFHRTEDFAAHGVSLISRYHTKTLMSYDWAFAGVDVSARYFLADEHALLCILELQNKAPQPRRVTVHATNIYGYRGHMYWGGDGVTSSYRPVEDAAVSKVWAYGDVMALGASQRSAAYKATSSQQQWDSWITSGDLSANSGAVVRFHETDDPIYAVMSYVLELPPGTSEALVIGLVRDVNELYALRRLPARIVDAFHEAARQLADDEHFYAQAPLLSGDWPTAWKHGWVYDLETLRMTIRRPLGIYKHPWDAMQIHSPRAVLGETCLDALCLSYSDTALAKEVIYGVFADAPMPNVPCSREDGSMNMIGESGAECGTAPTWGFPFLVIQSIYRRDSDDAWIRRLYPHLKAFIEWWLANRTDEDGWFHADNSWESGQDGSRRFLHGDAQEGTPAHFVRTVDIEAGMAQAMLAMVDYARIAGHPDDIALWQRLAEDRIARTRSMYVDGWFRDWDGRDNRPFLLEDYYDVMMLVPLAVGIATPEQIEGVRPKFQIFSNNPTPFLEWPSFWLPFSEAGWNAGLREFIAEELIKVGNRIYARTDAREVRPASTRYADRLPTQYNYRIPGVAREFWPVNLEAHPILDGCENYGWGATFPSLVIRNLIGFRELKETPNDRPATGFLLAPALPATLFEPGKTYGITNLRCGDCRFDVSYTVKAEGRLAVHLICRLPPAPATILVQDEGGDVLAQTDGLAATHELRFEAVNGGTLQVTWEKGN